MDRIKEKLSVVGDAIREKTGKNGLLSLDEMPAEIAAIETGAQIDDTLSISGMAADAKAVGDALETKQPKGDYALKNEILDANGLLKNDVLPEGYPYKGVGDILSETTVSIDLESGQGVIFDEFELYIGNSYIVNYNSTEYNCEAKSFMMEGIELIALGNIGVMDESGETEITDEPFLLINMPTAIVPSVGLYGGIIPLDGAEEVTLSISGNIIKKISKEFLPNIPNINNIVDGSEFGSVRTITASNIIGISAHAEGYKTTASGNSSHAEGSSNNNAFDFITEESTKEEIIAAWDENIFTLASGDSSHAEGDNTLAIGNSSHAEGSNTLASGDYSHAEGSGAIASSNFSHAEGFNTTASGSSSHAEGYNTIASGYNSHAEGFDTTASGNSSHAEGSNTLASGNSSHAEGDNTTASGQHSHAEGDNTTASGDWSHAEGDNTTASGQHSHAEGFNTTASGHNSHAEGSSWHNAFDFITEESTKEEIIAAWKGEGFTLASGSSSHAEGNNTLASGDYSHAEGYDTIASGYNSHAEGDNTIASGDHSHVQGKYNIEDTNNQYSHIVGNGKVISRSNAHTLDWEGNAWFAGDVYVGSTSGKNKDAGSKKLIATPSDAIAGDLLTYNGTNWVRISRADLIAEIVAALPRAEEASF